MSAIITEFKDTRRRIVKRLGKKTLRGFSDFMASQSIVGDPPVFDDPLESFPFLRPFEKHWTEIRDELNEVMRLREDLPAFHEISPDQYRISQGDRWKTYIFFGFRQKVDSNCKRCPVTTSLLEQVPRLQTAWFSILGPGYQIPAHRGVTKGIVRVHLGLVVPDEAERCTMRVADQTVVWEEGKCVAFDDTYDHEVHNQTDQDRVVLLFDFDRPMQLPGRIAHAAMLWLLKRTAYYKDPQRNLKAWEQRLEDAARRLEGLELEASDTPADTNSMGNLHQSTPQKSDPPPARHGQGS